MLELYSWRIYYYKEHFKSINHDLDYFLARGFEPGTIYDIEFHLHKWYHDHLIKSTRIISFSSLLPLPKFQSHSLRQGWRNHQILLRFLQTPFYFSWWSKYFDRCTYPWLLMEALKTWMVLSTKIIRDKQIYELHMNQSWRTLTLFPKRWPLFEFSASDSELSLHMSNLFKSENILFCYMLGICWSAILCLSEVNPIIYFSLKVVLFLTYSW